MAGKFGRKIKHQKKNFNIYSYRGKQYKFIKTPKLIQKISKIDKKQLPTPIELQLTKSIFEDTFSNFFD